MVEGSGSGAACGLGRPDIGEETLVDGGGRNGNREGAVNDYPSFAAGAQAPYIFTTQRLQNEPAPSPETIASSRREALRGRTRNSRHWLTPRADAIG